MNLYFFHLINDYAGRWPVLDAIGIFCSQYLWLVMTLVVVALFVFKFKKFRDLAVVAIGSAGVARIVFVSLVKWLYAHPRPDLVTTARTLVAPDSVNSFPSGHATYVFALAMGVYLYNKKLGWWFFLLAALASIARIFTGIHWPYDIIGGVALGLFSGWLGNIVYRHLKPYIRFLK